MEPHQLDKITYIVEDKYNKYNKHQAKEHYQEVLNKALEPLLCCEEIFFNDSLNEHYTVEDFHEIVREALYNSRAIKLPKYKRKSLDKFLELLELETTIK